MRNLSFKMSYKLGISASVLLIISQLTLSQNVRDIDERDNYLFIDSNAPKFGSKSPLNLLPVTVAVESVILHDKVPKAEVFLTKGNTEDTIPLSLEGDLRNDIEITESMVRNGTVFNHVVLLCNASYPIEWIYEGVGAPKLYTTQIRTIGSYYDANTYGHSNIVVLVQERFDEQQTGSYVCQGIENPELRTSFHLYFKGEFGFPALQNVVIQPRENDTTVILPCPTTDPAAFIGLYKMTSSGELRNLSADSSISYDPRRGFLIQLNEIKEPYGSYTCKFKDMDSLWKIQLVAPKSMEVQIFPNSDIVPMNNLADHSFSCKAKEPIQLTLPNTLDFGIITYSENISDPFRYKGVLKMTPNIPLFSVANYFKVNCVAKKSRRLLHSWEYSNFGTEDVKVTYDKNQRRLLCCSKSGLTPTHEFAKCDTVSDCNIKKHCFQSGRCDYAFPPKLVDAPRGCTAAEFIDDFPSHIMRCSVGQFSTMTMITSNVQNDDLIIYDGRIPETDKILQINTISQINDQVEVRCLASIFFFSTNILFAFERTDGSLDFADEALIENVNSYGPVLRTTIGPSMKSIICLAPLTRSAEWRNASLTIVDVDDIVPAPSSYEPVETSESERVVTSVHSSTSVATYIRNQRGQLIRVIQDV